jgi:CheY-like chemotaxis protein
MDGPTPRNGERPPGVRVLVVGDSQENVRMMGVLLKGQGHEVKLALTGREAINASGLQPRE